MSTYPNDKFDRHGTPRNTPAADWHDKRIASYSQLARGLATSLVPYVSEEDICHDRRTFLEIVRDRIEMDLLTNDY